jgi:phosphomannomutase
MHTQEIAFGTDGWRGIISDNFTFANVKRVAAAIAQYYIQSSKGPVSIAVGYDTRFLSEKYADTISNVLADYGITVWLANKAVPTPMLSYAVKHRHLTAGIMVTASHNPGEYNGIKIKTASGGAAGTDVTKAVEQILAMQQPVLQQNQRGTITQDDFSKVYVSFLKSYIDLSKIKKSKFRILVDVMHGSGNSFIAEVLKGSNLKLEFERLERNPWFGGLRPEPVVDNLQVSIQRMKKERWDACFVLDGDADRIAAILPGGIYLSPQKILGLLALHLHQDKGMNGGVVKTIVGTNLIDNLSSDIGLKLYETPVGFKYISALMDTEDILVGGEEAGGMGFKNYIPERDGSMSALLLLEMMVCRKKGLAAILADMEKKYGRYYYLRRDMKIKNPGMDCLQFKGLNPVLGRPVVKVKDFDGAKLICDNGDWVMFRGSGTEPIMRVYAESTSLKKTQKLIEFAAKLVLEVDAKG